MEENDRKVSLLERLIEHARATATTRSIMARAGTCTMSGDVSRTKRSSAFTMEISVPKFAARLLAVHHVDARAGVGDVWLC